MAEPHIEINVFTLAPTEPSPQHVVRPALPEMFGGYRPRALDLMATATLAETAIGTGVAWLFEHDDDAPLMWVRAAEVDTPYLATGLQRTLIDALLQTGKQMGFAQAYIEPALRVHLARRH